MGYNKLLSQGRIGSVTLANRIVMPAMDQNMCDDGEITDGNIAHYEARAAGGVGLLILETSAVAWPIGATSIHQPALSDDKFIPGLARLADAVHRYGSKMFVQICHHGKTAGVDAIQDREQIVPSVPLPDDPSDMSAIAMSELMMMAKQTGGKYPQRREATTDDIAWVVDQFAEAAHRVQKAGLDGVEIHAAHGYLISTFLSPRYNKRTDEYGGSLENRARLLVEVIGAIKAKCGADFPVIARLDGVEYAEGGITLEESTEYARIAEEAGADAIHVSAVSPNAMGAGFTDGPLPWQADQYIGFAARVKLKVKVPVIAVGRIMPDAAEKHLANEDCDFVAMGRQLLADPEIPAKLRSGRPDRVRTCINCFVCVAQNFWDGTPICAVNAQLGHYDEAKPKPVTDRQNIVVVGGGPAGMEAARIAASRGHRVTLLEKAPHLGGTARFSSLTTPMNAELVRYLSTEMNELDVDVRLSTPVTASLLRELNADVVIVATGARRERPQIPGAESNHVLTGDDLRGMLTGDDPAATKRLDFIARCMVSVGRTFGFLRDMTKLRTWSKRWMPVGKNVVVIGGGLVGVEIAEFLAERSRKVTVLEADEKLGMEMAHPRRARALFEARKHGVKFETKAEVVSIEKNKVIYEVDGERRSAPATTVVVASGVHADSTIADQLKADGFKVEIVGDAQDVGYIEGAIRSGYLVGRDI